MENMTLLGILKISIVIPILMVCSVIMVSYALERFWAFMKVGSLDTHLSERIKQCVRQGQIKEAIALCGKNQSFITHSLEVALNAAHFPREEMESIFALYRMKLQGLLNKHLAVFGTFAFICPLVGLLGTVLGVIRSFRDLALSGSGGPTIVAAGISEAVISTAAGIGVAIMAAITYNWFNIWMKGSLSSVDIFGQEMIFMTN